LNGTERKHIQPGTRVAVVQKQDQGSGRRTLGIVRDILTRSATHPRGIKVRLASGEVGRVQEILGPPASPNPEHEVSMKSKKSKLDSEKIDQVVLEARRKMEQIEKAYREKALQLFPWVCGRCGREFTNKNVHQLTVHHRDSDHTNNPPDGSNWELLCIYCHDNEHSRGLDQDHSGGLALDAEQGSAATYKPFAGLKDLLKKK
jgi:uncharacterized repeat protein (TIGR03833 family)